MVPVSLSPHLSTQLGKQREVLWDEAVVHDAPLVSLTATFKFHTRCGDLRQSVPGDEFRFGNYPAGTFVQPNPPPSSTFVPSSCCTTRHCLISIDHKCSISTFNIFNNLVCCQLTTTSVSSGPQVLSAYLPILPVSYRQNWFSIVP